VACDYHLLRHRSDGRCLIGHRERSLASDPPFSVVSESVLSGVQMKISIVIAGKTYRKVVKVYAETDEAVKLSVFVEQKELVNLDLPKEEK
jgi:hypothetical protein